MKRTIVLPLMIAFGLVAAACGGGTTNTGVASLDAANGDIQTQSDADRSLVRIPF